MWLAIPADKVSWKLSTWRSEDGCKDSAGCGTTACFGGWCAIHPAFQAQGIYALPFGKPAMIENNAHLSGGEISDKLFGDSALFVARGEHQEDAKAHAKDSDWQIVMNRLNSLIYKRFINIDSIPEHQDVKNKIKDIQLKLDIFKIAEQSKKAEIEDLEDTLVQIHKATMKLTRELSYFNRILAE